MRVPPLPPDPDLKPLIRLRTESEIYVQALRQSLPALQRLEERSYPVGEVIDVIADALREQPAEPGSPARIQNALETFLEEVREQS